MRRRPTLLFHLVLISNYLDDLRRPAFNGVPGDRGGGGGGGNGGSGCNDGSGTDSEVVMEVVVMVMVLLVMLGR